MWGVPICQPPPFPPPPRPARRAQCNWSWRSRFPPPPLLSPGESSQASHRTPRTSYGSFAAPGLRVRACVCVCVCVCACAYTWYSSRSIDRSHQPAAVCVSVTGLRCPLYTIVCCRICGRKHIAQQSPISRSGAPPPSWCVCELVVAITVNVRPI